MEMEGRRALPWVGNHPSFPIIWRCSSVGRGNRQYQLPTHFIRRSRPNIYGGHRSMRNNGEQMCWGDGGGTDRDFLPEGKPSVARFLVWIPFPISQGPIQSYSKSILRFSNFLFLISNFSFLIPHFSFPTYWFPLHVKIEIGEGKLFNSLSY